MKVPDGFCRVPAQYEQASGYDREDDPALALRAEADKLRQRIPDGWRVIALDEGDGGIPGALANPRKPLSSLPGSV